jgi:transcriptional regulator with XRE-family HTH domain
VRPPSPVVANWELVIRIRERREQLGLTVKDITEPLGFTRNYWSAIENERQIIPESTLRNVLNILEFGQGDRDQLLKLRETAKDSGWWARYSALFDGSIQRLFGLEHGAQQVHCYDSILIPGLLQTADYAREIISTDTSIRPVEVEQRVEARLHRQERLHDANPLRLTVIIGEAALRQQIGGTTVQRGQLDHLLRMIRSYPETLDFRVIPFTATACNLFGASTLSLLDFQNPRLPRIVWHETVTTWGVIADTIKVRDISMAFVEASEHTLDRQKTAKFIANCRKEVS